MNFGQFLHDRLERGGFTTEDTLATFLPLVRQVVEAHQQGLVAPLEGIEHLQVEGLHVWFEQGRLTKPRTSAARVRELSQPRSRALEVVQESRFAADVDDGAETRADLRVGTRGADLTQAVYLPGYVSWEHEIGHHDPLTDVFSLGMILASLGCGLDFRDADDVAAFVRARSNLFALNPHLHPVLGRAIVRMTELNRHKRPQDLAAVLHTLENYRDQNLDLDVELARRGAFQQKDRKCREEMILSTLQQRLFEISRRNRLLHFRPTLQTMNLTLASVPLAFAIESLRPDQILTWTRALQEQMVSGAALSLNTHLRFEEALYVPGTLDRIASEARREQAEFGFAQLRLAICFLRWSNLKATPVERFESPLVLLPVRLTKKKGVRDAWLLEAMGSEAEVNPVLRHYLKQLYDLELPEQLDLAATTLDEFFAFLAARIQASEPAIEIAKIDRPRIQLVHSLARRRLDQYRRRVRLSGRGVRTLADIDYSYEPENFHPLGLALFRERIRPPDTNVRTILEEQPRPRSFISPPADSPVVEKERSLYALTEDDGANPYHWEFDLCNITLGSFRYRKLSLVRDYAALLEDKPENPACEAIFSRDPRPVEPADKPVALAERCDVVPCDPTQATAIARARAGTSYIIQGPPGTGKSQTITNLIADFVGRGKRVLFVCEKRAAIDVVYQRLCSTGLSPLCCLIHDSQLDKRDFVLNLKETYEAFLDDKRAIAGDRVREKNRLIADIERDVGPLHWFDERMRCVPPQAGTTVRRLLHQAVKLRRGTEPLAAEIAERVPAYAVWREKSDAIGHFSEALSRIQPDGVFGNHPLRRVSPRLLVEERPVARVSRAVESVRALLADIEALLAAGGPAAGADTPAIMAAVQVYVERVAPLAERDLLSLVERGSAASKRLDVVGKKYRTAVQKLEAARCAAAGWKQPLPPADATTALEQAREFERSWLPALRPGWWRLRQILQAAYDFKAHTVRPSWSRILTWLSDEHAARATVDELESEARQEFGSEERFGDFLDFIACLRKDAEAWPEVVRNLHRHCFASPDGGRLIASLGQLKPLLEKLHGETSGVLEDFEGLTIGELRHELGRIAAAPQGLPDFLHCLASLEKLPAEFKSAVRTLPFDLSQLEWASAERTLQEIYRADRELDGFDGQSRSKHVNRLAEVIGQWRAVNASVVCDSVRRQFLDNVRIASLPAAQLPSDQKEFKKQYQRGRRELEHEFGKTMRYRSIRDLASGDPGLVVRDLKPVWLMSPLSVSDTLPLDTRLFDVVIFDEASQITLEEAIPSVFRGLQTIVVGDRMQLPPTNFFSARQSSEDEPLQIEEEAGQVIEYDLSSDSLLEHASRKLSSTMLGWHYRSRSESLISFSNAAFYQGKLLTIPEESLGSSSRAEIVVSRPADGDATIDRLLDRAVSFHFLPNGVYQRRKNADEAGYIAHLVRALLVRRTKMSIGIVAFSEAQQTEIEEALERLSRDDREFRELYEAEREREENDQFLGLLVKNLENIQGDERDVMIMSICYGYDANRRMLMNFGPINQCGGEKRLNVAFSRARHHMAVVSSIRPHDITNEYNDGANCLRNYLRYAEATSAGDLAAARRVLDGYSTASQDAPELPDGDAVAEQVAAELTARGFHIERQVGQSMLRCDLAVCRSGDEAYRLGILLDTDAFYRHPDVLEKNLLRPRLLEEFGWKIAHVLTKDWHRDPQSVIDSLLERLESRESRNAAP
jgi:hypothetical protein